MTAMDWGAMSRAERDAAYNNSAAVAGNADYAVRWTAASTPSEPRTRRPSIFPTLPERTKWDLFPAADPNAPCLVHIHGGYWQRNSREVFSCLTEGVARHGWSAALPG